MNQVVLAALADPGQYTGQNHTRIVELLAILAILSIVIWTFVLLSLIVRQVMAAGYKIMQSSHARKALSQKKAKGRHGS